MRLTRCINRFYRNQTGAMGVFVAISFATLLGFAVLAIDISTMILVKSQLQNAADAGALAGAQELINNDSTAAVLKAIQFAGENYALIYGGASPSPARRAAATGLFNVMDSVKITAADVTFPEPTKITVTTHRTEATGDPFRTYFMRAINPNGTFGNMTARATAGFLWVCGGTCLKPWAPPDRWFDADGDSTYNYDPVTNPTEHYDPITTGYNDTDLGTAISLVLMNGNDAGFGQFFYYSVNFPPVNDGNPISGADEYEEWMCTEGCLDNSFTVDIGDVLRVEPGKMIGPNNKGLKCIIDTDPTAEWDAVEEKVINSAFATSPRIVKAALFDPSIGLDPSYPGVGGNVVHVVKIMVLFIEEDSKSDQIVGRFMRLSDPGGTTCEDQSNPTFLYKTALLE